ncbi:hypothetical protein [Paenarthrobacter sp. NPDC089316]|uniref:hypothetical protein n=1 Tax=unclassified Paenarthrobacter TaxID=2634190 RepID=UPI003449AE92
MSTTEFPDAGSASGRTPLRSMWTSHLLRNFDLSGKAPSITQGGEAVLREVLPNALFPRGASA